MGYDGGLAYTGAGLSVFGTQIGVGWLLAAAIVLIVGGSLLYRIGKRATSGRK